MSAQPWQARAACRERPELFAVPDPVTGPGGMELREGPKARRARERAAVQVCWECPVWRECREWALRDRGQQETVCGGLTPRQLRQERQRSRGLGVSSVVA